MCNISLLNNFQTVVVFDYPLIDDRVLHNCEFRWFEIKMLRIENGPISQRIRKEENRWCSSVWIKNKSPKNNNENISS